MNANQSQSIIKLPLIFIVLFIPIEWLVSSFRSFFTNSSEFEGSYFQYISYYFHNIDYFFNMFGFYLLFFVIAILCCQTYRLHQLRRDFWRIFIIAVISSGTFSYVIIFLYELKIKSDDFFWNEHSFKSLYYINSELYGLFYLLIFLFSSISVSTALIFLINLVFFVFAKKNLNLRQDFHADLSEKNKINCFNYSVLMLIPSVMWLIFNTFQLSDNIQENYLSVLIDNFAMLLMLLIQYPVTYFSVYKTFSSINSLINFKKLIVSMLICVTISIILSCVLVYHVQKIIIINKLDDFVTDKTYTAMLWWSIKFCYLVLSCIFSRYLVKRIYVDNS